MNPCDSLRPEALRDLTVTLAALALLLWWEASGWDLVLAARYGSDAGFALRDAWWTRDLLHQGGRWLSGAALAGAGLMAWHGLGSTLPRRRVNHQPVDALRSHGVLERRHQRALAQQFVDQRAPPHRHALPGQRSGDQFVVAREAQPRRRLEVRQPDRFQPRLPFDRHAARHGGTEQQQRVADQVGRRRQRQAPQQRRAAHRQRRLAEQRLAFERRGAAVADCEVEALGRERALLEGRVEPHVDARMRTRELGQARDQPERGQPRRGGQRQHLACRWRAQLAHGAA
jgi:hypothetical protein